MNMPTIIRVKFFLIICLLTVTYTYSQDERSKTESNFKGGVRAGFTASQISGDDLSGYNKFGGYTGAFVNFPLVKDKKWLFQFELNFIMKGSSTFSTVNADGMLSDKYVLTLMYIESPFLVKWLPLKGIELELGPSLNFLCYGAEKFNGFKEPGRQPFRFYEIAVVVGVGYLFKSHLGINFRWSSSIVPVRVPNFVFNRLIKKQFNDSLALSLYYQF